MCCPSVFLALSLSLSLSLFLSFSLSLSGGKIFKALRRVGAAEEASYPRQTTGRRRGRDAGFSPSIQIKSTFLLCDRKSFSLRRHLDAERGSGEIGVRQGGSGSGNRWHMAAAGVSVRPARGGAGLPPPTHSPPRHSFTPHKHVPGGESKKLSFKPYERELIPGRSSVPAALTALEEDNIETSAKILHIFIHSVIF